MSEFVNTVDLYGDKEVLDRLASMTIVEFHDNIISKLINYAFGYNKAIETVILPAVKSMGQYAFCQCSSLEYADFSKLVSIPNSTFYYCSRLSTLVLRNETLVTLGGTNAFVDTQFASGKSGGTLLIPRSLVESYNTATNWSSILSQNAKNRFLALEDCTTDGTITGEIDWDKLNSGSTELYARAFVERTLTSFESDEITTLPNGVFRSCGSLISVHLPNVTSVEDNAFSDCTKLYKVYLPNIRNIYSYAFYKSKITKIDLSNVTDIDLSAFSECTSLLNVKLPATPPTIKGSGQFSNINAACVFYIPTGSLAAYQADSWWSNMVNQYSFVEEDR